MATPAEAQPSSSSTKPRCARARRSVLPVLRAAGADIAVGWAEATAEPVFLTRLLDAQAERCPPFRVFFALTFSDAFGADHPKVTVTALGGASAGRRFFAGRRQRHAGQYFRY